MKSRNRSGAIREKALRMRSGWRYDWYDPRSDQTIVIQEVIRGSFVYPQLVSASPFVFIASGQRSCESTSSCIQIAKPLKGSFRCANLRRGIPDPWAEYLTFRGVREASARVCPQEVNLWADNLFLTDSMWQKWGLPFGQGIPDPWRNWPKIIGWRNKKARKKIKEKEDIGERNKKRTGKECMCAVESRSPNESPQPIKEFMSLEESSSASESCGTKFLCSQNLKMKVKPTINRNRGNKQTCASCKCDSSCGPVRKQQECFRPKRQPLRPSCERVYKKNVPKKNYICNKNCESPLTAMASNESRVQNVRTKYAGYPGAIHLTYSREMPSVCAKNDNVELLPRAKSSSTESFSPSPATRKEMRLCTRKLNNMPQKCMCTPVSEKNNSTEIYGCKCQCSCKLYTCASPENCKRNAIPGNTIIKSSKCASLCAKPPLEQHTVTCSTCSCPQPLPDTALGKKNLRDFEKCIKRDTLQENNVNDRISSRIANTNQANFHCSTNDCSRSRTQRTPIKRAHRRCAYCKYECKEKQGTKLDTTLSPDTTDLKCNICNCNIHNCIGVVYDNIKRVNHRNVQFNDGGNTIDYRHEHGTYPKYKLSACTYKKKARCRLCSFQWSNKGKGKKKGNRKKGKRKGKAKRKKKNNEMSSGNRKSLSPGTYYRLVLRRCSSFADEGVVRLSEDHGGRVHRHRELERPAERGADRNIDCKCEFCGCNITQYEDNHVPLNHVKVTLPLRNELRELPSHSHPARASEGLKGKAENIVLRKKRKRNRDERESGYRTPYLHDIDSGEMGDVSATTVVSYLSSECERKIGSGGKYIQTDPLPHSSRFIDKNPTSPQVAQEKYIQSINSLNDRRKKYSQDYSKHKYYMKEINNSDWGNFRPEETCPAKKPVDVQSRDCQVMWKAHTGESEEYRTFLKTNRELIVRNEEKLKLGETKEARPYYLKPSNFVMPDNIPLCDKEMKQNDGMTNDEMFPNRKFIASSSRNICGELGCQAADSRTFRTGNSSITGQRLPDTYSRNGRHNIYYNLSEVLRENNNVSVDSTTFGEWVENKEKEIKHYHYEEVPGENMTKIQPIGNISPAKETIASYLMVNYKSQGPSTLIDEKMNRRYSSSLHIKNKTLPEYNPFSSVEDNVKYATEISKTSPELQVRVGNGYTAVPFLRKKENDRSKWQDTNTYTNKVQDNVKLSARESKYFSGVLDESGKKIILHTESQSICNQGTHNVQQPFESVTSLNEKGFGDEIPSRKKVKEYQTLRRENENVHETVIFSQPIPFHNEENIQPLSKMIDTEKQPKYKGSKLEEVDLVIPLARKLTNIYPSRAIGDNVTKYPEVVPEDRVSKLENHKRITLPPNEGNEMFAVKFNSFLNEFRPSDGNQLSHLRGIRPVDLSPELQFKKVIGRNSLTNINDSDAFLLERGSIKEKFSTENNTVDNISFHRRISTSCSAPAERNNLLSNLSTRNCNEIAEDFSSAKQCVVKRETSNFSPKSRNEKRMLTFIARGIKDDTKILVSEMDEKKQEAVTERTLSGGKINSPKTREVEEELMNFDVLEVHNKDRRDHLTAVNIESEDERPHYSGTSPRKNITKNIKKKEVTPKSTTRGHSSESSELEEEIKSIDLDKRDGTSQGKDTHREDRIYISNPPTPASSVQEVLGTDQGQQGQHLTRKKSKDLDSRTRKLERTISVNTTDVEEGIVEVLTPETERNNSHFIHTEDKHLYLNKSGSLSSGAELYDRPQKEARVRKCGVLRRSAKFTSPPAIHNFTIPGLPNEEEFEPAVPSSEETIIKNIVYE